MSRNVTKRHIIFVVLFAHFDIFTHIYLHGRHVVSFEAGYKKILRMFNTQYVSYISTNFLISLH